METGREKKIKSTETYVGRAFMAFICLAMLINILRPEKEGEDMSCRRPRFTWDAVASGAYMRECGDYLSRGFVGRDFLCGAKTALKRLGGSREENGVFMGSKGRLLADVASPDEAALNKNLSAIKDFADRHKDISMSMIIVPDAAQILKESLPRLASVFDQGAFINRVRKNLGSSVQWVDAAKALESHREEEIYYKTDHRWTSRGAFYVFQEAAEALGLEKSVSSRFVSYPVSVDFCGSLAKASFVRPRERDRIDIYVPRDTDNDVTVNYVDGYRKSTSLYSSDGLKGEDKYKVFLGGDCSLIHIRTMSERRNRLLLVKDSFADCFVPFLAPFYREIVVADPSYYKGSLDDLADTYRITDVMFLYGGNGFFCDNCLSGVLKIGKPDRERVF